MTCENTPACKKPCGHCPEAWPIPAGSEYGAQSPAEGYEMLPLPEPETEQQLRRHNISGHERWFTWDAVKPPHDMAHYAMTATPPRGLYTADQMRSYGARCANAALANVQPKGREAIEWQSGPNQFKDWCAQWFGPDADDAYLARAVASFPAGQPTMGELPPQIAIDKAKAAMGYSQAFDGKGIDWQSSEPWPHRIELAQALDWITDLGAVILNLADRVVPPLVLQAPAVGADDARDAALWRYVMDWGQPKFAVCRRVGPTGACWEPIKTSGPVEDAMGILDVPVQGTKEPT